jgi:predicted GNAT superfamily acetyltransferase
VITVRHLAGADALDACVRMQRDTWGAEWGELVPRSMLLVSQKLGGIVAGAFDGDGGGPMLGFVFGMTGLVGGEVVHWSDMLAVRGDARDRGIGRALKAFQRDAVLAMGIRTMYWTYDPLVARNAHLNLNVLGAQVVEYVTDMYGASNSPLHTGLGTDRFIVRWCLDGQAPRTFGAVEARIEIPAAIDAVQARSAAEAADWRARTRAAFRRAFDAGLTVSGFDDTHYTLART